MSDPTTPAPKRAALLNCPFCGGIAKNVSAGVAGPSNRFHAGDSIFAVNCSKCGGSVPNRYRNELVVEAWNRRTSTATPPAQEVPTDEQFIALALEHGTELRPAQRAAAISRGREAWERFRALAPRATAERTAGGKA